jgi:hypothetical protein
MTLKILALGGDGIGGNLGTAAMTDAIIKQFRLL